MDDHSNQVESSRDVFTSAYFVTALLLLLVNDFFLKETYHNQLTGKLSDVAGLFIFPIFMSFIFRAKKTVYFLTIFLFVFWKSEYASPLINYWNGMGLFRIQRTIDMTDLYALLIIPFSYRFKGHLQLRSVIPTRYLRVVIMALAWLSFIATAGTHGNVARFNMNGSKAEVYTALKMWAKDYPQNVVPDSFPGPPEQIISNGKTRAINEFSPFVDSVDFKLYRPKNKKYPVIRYIFNGRSAGWHDHNSQLVLLAVTNKYGNSLFEKDLNGKDRAEAIQDLEELVIRKIEKYLDKSNANL